jgi:methyl-accepting chemotaxis protein
VEQLDRQSEDIAQSTNVIHDSICRVGDALDGFAQAARDNDTHLGASLRRMGQLEQQANGMFDTIVRSGFAHEDGAMVELALAERDVYVEKAEAALKTGSLTEAQLFDTQYRVIPGSNPERYDTRFNDWADVAWRPELDRAMGLAPNIVATVCSDLNGYLPTHSTRYSRPPTGDVLHDAANCRNRRILVDDNDRKAKASNKPFTLAVYRRDREDGGYDVVRNVYVPIFIGGRRWGDFEIAYKLN